MAVEDELRLDFQGEDSSMSSTAAKVVSQINTLDSSINKLINSFNTFSQVSSSAESGMSHFSKSTSGLEEIGSKIEKMTESFNNLNPAIENLSNSFNDFNSASDSVENLKQKIESKKAAIESDTGATEEAKNKADSLKNSNKGLSQSFTEIATSVGSVYGLLKKWTLGAADATRAQTRFNAVFDSTNGELAEARKWVDWYSDSLYLDSIEVENAISKFRVLTNSMGMNNEKSKEMSFNMTQLAYDLKAVSGNDISQTVNQLTSALSGQTKALSEYGIAIDNNTMQQYLNAHGIDRKVASLNEAERAEVRYMKIMEGSAGIQGYYAKTLMSPSNALNIIKTQFGLLAREIGNVFIPILMALVPIVITITKALRSLAQALASFFGIKIDFNDYSQGLSLMADGVGGIGDTADSTSKKVKNMLRDFDDLHVVDFGDDSDSGSAGTGGAGAGLGGGQSLFDPVEYADWSKYITEIGDKFKVLEKIILAVGAAILGWNIGKLIGKFLELIGILDKAKVALLALGTALLGAGLVLVFDANKDIRINGLNKFNIIQTIVGAIVAGAGGALVALAFGAAPEVALTIGLIIGISLAAINFLTGIAKSLQDKYHEEIEKLKTQGGWYEEGTGLGKKIGIILDIVGQVTSMEIVELLGKMLKGLNDTVDQTTEKFEKVRGTLESIFNVVGNVKAQFEGFIDEAITPLRDAFSTFFSDVSKSFSDFYNDNKELVDGIVNFFEVVIVSIITKKIIDIQLFLTTVIGIIKAVITTISGLIQSLLKFISGIIDSILNIITGFIKIFDGIVHGDLFKVIDGIKHLFDGVSKFIETIFKGILNIAASLLNGLIELFNSFIRAANRIKIPDWDIFGSLAGKTLGIPEIPKIPLYAEGGFPDKGQLFIANEREPELIGSMGNRSVVANNAQITEGIAQASYGAFKQALSEMGQNFGGDTVVYVGDTQITDVITKKKKIQDKRFGR